MHPVARLTTPVLDAAHGMKGELFTSAGVGQRPSATVTSGGGCATSALVERGAGTTGIGGS
jgi:hypothetical protein